MKKWLSLLLTVILFLSSTTVFAEAAESPQVKRGGILTVPKTNALTSLDPTRSTAFAAEDGIVLMQIYETLLDFDENNNLCGRLAERFEVSDDNTVITFYLRQDVTFHDGEKFNAEAVKANIDWIISEECAHPSYAAELTAIVGCEVIDEYTCRLILSKPDATVLPALANQPGVMQSPKTIAEKTSAVAPAGTGPFRLKTHVEGAYVYLEANPDYYRNGVDGKPLPYLDEVHIIQMNDDSVKSANLRSGDLDGLDYHSSTYSLIKAESWGNMNTIQFPYASNYFISFNLNNPILDNELVRKAISFAVNRQQVIDVVLEGYGIITPFVGQPHQWYYSDYSPYTYDLEKAKALLAEAGYADGLELTLSYIAREPDATMCQLLQAQLKEVGITVKLEALERLAWIDLIRTQHGGELGFGVLGNNGMDPSRQYNSTTNYLEPTKVQHLKDLVAPAKETFVQAERKPILDAYQKAYLDGAYHVFVAQKPNYTSFRKGVEGLKVFWLAALDFSEVWLND